MASKGALYAGAAACLIGAVAIGSMEYRLYNSTIKHAATTQTVSESAITDDNAPTRIEIDTTTQDNTQGTDTHSTNNNTTDTNTADTNSSALSGPDTEVNGLPVKSDYPDYVAAYRKFAAIKGTAKSDRIFDDDNNPFSAFAPDNVQPVAGRYIIGTSRENVYNAALLLYTTPDDAAAAAKDLETRDNLGYSVKTNGRLFVAFWSYQSDAKDIKKLRKQYMAVLDNTD